MVIYYDFHFQYSDSHKVEPLFSVGWPKDMHSILKSSCLSLLPSFDCITSVFLY